MPNVRGRFTDQEAKFIEVVAVTGDPKIAAKEAGYKNASSPHRKMLSPAVLAEIARVQTEKLVSELAPIALATLTDIMTSKTAPAGARVQAAKVVLDKGGIGVKGADADGKEPHEMSGDELAQAIQRLTSEVEERRRPTIEAVATPVPEASIFD